MADNAGKNKGSNPSESNPNSSAPNQPRKVVNSKTKSQPRKVGFIFYIKV